MDRRPASARRFVERSTVEQQKGLAVTFFVRIWNTGNATGSFLVDGDHGGAVFTVRYLAGGTGEDRTERVVDGTYLIENVPAGETRTLRIRVTLAPNAPIDRTGRGGSSCTPRVRRATATWCGRPSGR